MSCHDIGRGLSSVVKVILEKLDSGEISESNTEQSCCMPAARVFTGVTETKTKQ